MKTKIKTWFNRHKQLLILILIISVVVILAVSTIARGVYTLKDMSSDTQGVSDDNISFVITNDTTETIGKTHSADKLYRDRESAAPAPQKDVDISFGAIFEQKGDASAALSGQAAGREINKSVNSTPQNEESVRIRQELNAIYGRSESATGTDKSVINNTNIEDESKRPLTEEEQLAQQKKLMEDGFSMPEPNGISVSDPITISSPSEIPAFIHGAQTVKNGNRLALRIDIPVVLSNGQTIPRNTIIYGAITIEQNRVQVAIESIKYRTMIYTLPMTGFGEDGMPGLPVQIEQNQKIIGDASSSAAASALDKTISTATRGLVGSVVRDISNATKTKKESYVSFIDNQKIFFRLSPKK